MSFDFLTGKDFSAEFLFNASRSSGPGGQNVNKVNSKIELRFNITLSSIINEDEKKLLFQKLASKITDQGELVIVSQKDRSQIKNKELAIEKFYMLVNKALTPKKVRKPTTSTKASKERRLETKRITSIKKQYRKNPGL